MVYATCRESRNPLATSNEIGSFRKNNVIRLCKENENGICETIYPIKDCNAEEFSKLLRFKSQEVKI